MAISWTDRLEDLSVEEWDSVLSVARRPSPFLSRHFLVPWAKAFASGHEKRLYRWAPGGEAAGFVFLWLREAGVGWELLGGEQVSDSLDALVVAGKEAQFWSEFLSAARELFSSRPLLLPNLVEGSPSIGCLLEVSAELGYECRLEEMDRSPYISLPASFEEYLLQLGTKERHELRRKIRRAEEAAPELAFRVTRTKEEFDRDFPAFLSLHRKSQTAKAQFMDERMAEFFRAMAEGFFSCGRLRLGLLSGENGDMAAALQLEWNGSLLLYNSGFDPAKRASSPGVVLLARCIDDAIRHGFGEYDFLRGRERYKYDLGGTDRIVYRAVLRAP